MSETTEHPASPQESEMHDVEDWHISRWKEAAASGTLVQEYDVPKVVGRLCRALERAEIQRESATRALEEARRDVARLEQTQRCYYDLKLPRLSAFGVCWDCGEPWSKFADGHMQSRHLDGCRHRAALSAERDTTAHTEPAVPTSSAEPEGR